MSKHTEVTWTCDVCTTSVESLNYPSGWHRSADLPRPHDFPTGETADLVVQDRRIEDVCRTCWDGASIHFQVELSRRVREVAV